MPFNGYLKLAQSQDLIVAASDGGLFNVPRAQLLAGLPPLFVSTLDLFPNPADQFQSDLGALNGVERLADGTVPIVTFLTNAAFQLKLRSRPEEAKFREAANGIGNTSVGVPDLPAPEGLKEIIDNEQIVAEDDTVGIGFLRAGTDMARAVARIAVPRFDAGTPAMLDNGQPWVLLGTSWMIGPKLALTNRHVINARRSDEPVASDADLETQALHSTLEFGFDTAEAPVTKATVTRLVATSSQLDYALLEVDGAPDVPIPRLRPNPVVVNPASRLSVNIIQHPRGEPKQIAFRNNLVSAADAELVRYFTDTDYGSSGSPVCDDSWRVVALHRGARHTEGANYQGRTEAFVNIGSQIQAVLADIGAKDATAASAINGAQA